jgi:hypothetical protein
VKCLQFPAGLLLLGGVANAQAVQQPVAPQSQTNTARPAPADPVICEKQEDTGTRLSSRKVCHTRSEWQQLRLDDRGEVDKIQRDRPMDGR